MNVGFEEPIPKNNVSLPSRARLFDWTQLWRRPQPPTLSAPRAKVDFFISHLEMNEDIKMHKFPAWRLNKNANERLRVLMMQRAGPLFISWENIKPGSKRTARLVF